MSLRAIPAPPRKKSVKPSISRTRTIIIASPNQKLTDNGHAVANAIGGLRLVIMYLTNSLEALKSESFANQHSNFTGGLDARRTWGQISGKPSAPGWLLRRVKGEKGSYARTRIARTGQTCFRFVPSNFRLASCYSPAATRAPGLISYIWGSGPGAMPLPSQWLLQAFRPTACCSSTSPPPSSTKPASKSHQVSGKSSIPPSIRLHPSNIGPPCPWLRLLTRTHREYDVSYIGERRGQG